MAVVKRAFMGGLLGRTDSLVVVDLLVLQLVDTLHVHASPTTEFRTYIRSKK